MFDTSLSHGLSILRPVFVGLWRVFEAFCTFMDNFWQAFGVALLTGMWALLLVNAIARWTGVLPIGWSLEITAYMVAWSILVMMGPVTRADGHIKVTFLPEKVLGEKRGASFMHALENLVGLALCIFLAIQAYDLVVRTHDFGYRIESSGGWYYPMWIVRSGILVGFSFSALYYFERTVKWIRMVYTGGEMMPSAGIMGTASRRSSVQEEESKPESGNDT